MKFFQMTPKQVAEQLNTNPTKGLVSWVIDDYEEFYGTNTYLKKKKAPVGARFLAHCKEYMVILSMIAGIIYAIVSFVNREYFNLLIAFFVICLILLSCFILTALENSENKVPQSYNKHKTFEARVLRDGKTKIIDATEVVVGDILLLSAGDLVVADGRIYESTNLKVDESVLTGNNQPADKYDEVIAGENHTVSELHNMVFSHTYVVSGEAKIIVTAIGLQTQIGKTMGEMSEQQSKTPIQRQLIQMSKVLNLILLAVVTFVFILGVIFGKNLMDMLLTSVCLGVAAAPICVSSICTAILSANIKKLSKKGVAVKNLDTIETLGSTGVIFTGKTGVLTKNKMLVSTCYVKNKILPFSSEHYREVAEVICYGSMCNNSYLKMVDGNRVCVGDATEGGILSALEAMGKEKESMDIQYPKMGEIPFDVERRRMSSVHVIEGRNLVIVKGSPDTVLEKCSDDAETIEEAMKANDIMSSKSLRVLAIAVKEIDAMPPELFVDEIESDLTLIGLIGLADTPGDKTAAALAFCNKAGINTVMITGDHILAAKSAAEQMGIYKEGDMALSGEDLTKMEPELLQKNIEQCRVFSGLSPSQKDQVVQAWQKKGHVVVMTGDDVNDSMALKTADVGCAIGSRCKDIIKNAAELIMEKADFSTIVATIRQSRGTRNNIKKVIQYLLSCNVAEALTICVAIICSFALPILPLQLLWINVLVLLLPALALGVETAREGLMNKPPVGKRDVLISKTMFINMIVHSILLMVVTIFAYLIGTEFLPQSEELFVQGQTMAFGVFSVSALFLAFSYRSKHSLFKIKWLSNLRLNKAILISLGLILFVMLIPGVNTLFGMTMLSFGNWIIMILLSTIPLIVGEVIKIIKKR